MRFNKHNNRDHYNNNNYYNKRGDNSHHFSHSYHHSSYSHSTKDRYHNSSHSFSSGSYYNKYPSGGEEIKSGKDKLIVGGRKCIIHYNPELSSDIEQGKLFIQWLKTEIFIDQFDIRVLLEDTTYIKNKRNQQTLTPEELKEEEECDSERWKDLKIIINRENEIMQEELEKKKKLKPNEQPLPPKPAEKKITFQFNY